MVVDLAEHFVVVNGVEPCGRIAVHFRNAVHELVEAYAVFHGKLAGGSSTLA